MAEIKYFPPDYEPKYTSLLDLPTKIGDVHQSVYRAYGVLVWACWAIRVGIPREVITSLVAQAMEWQQDEEKRKQGI